MLKHYLTISAILFCLISHAQIEYLDANNVRAGFSPGGVILSRPEGYEFSLFNCPKDIQATGYLSGIGPTGLCVFAQDINNGISSIALSRYNTPDDDFTYGPISTSYDIDYHLRYEKVFKITQHEIELHVALHGTSGYNIPDHILNWPGNGRSGKGELSQMAPYVDLNANGIYEPALGEYPDICGDEAVFFIMNDVRARKDSGDNAMNLEVHGLAYQFYFYTFPLQTKSLNNTVFVHYKVINRSHYNYNPFYMGLFCNADLGNFSNDAVGCDTNLNMGYFYNRTPNDNDWDDIPGYGTRPVAQGVTYLNHNMHTFSMYTNSATFETVVPDPQYVLQGFWNDATPITEGGVGYGGSVPTRYMFPGDLGNSNDWTELTIASLLPAGDRKFIQGIEPVTLKAGEHLDVDVAFTCSYRDNNNTTDIFKIVDTLKRDVFEVQHFYNYLLKDCGKTTTAISNTSPESIDLNIFPNPAHNALYITYNINKPATLNLYSLTGAVISSHSITSNYSVDVSNFAPGIYFAEINCGEKLYRKKFVIE